MKPMIPLLAFLWSFSSGLLVPVWAQTAHPGLQKAPRPDAIAKIENDYQKRRITVDEWALYTVYALFDSRRLPAEYRETSPGRLATIALNRIWRRWNALSPTTREQLRAYGFTTLGALSRPEGLDSTRTTPHFKIHYSVKSGDQNAVDTTDTDRNGTPDYIDTVMQILERAWKTQIDTMGYVPPPPDSLENGTAYYDVYIFKIDDFIYGYVQSELLVSDNPNSPDVEENNAATSYMVLRNHYRGFPGNDERNLKVTIAHELFHSIQFGYDAFEMPWLFEATATWMEDELYDEVNDNYQYLILWFERPEAPLDATVADNQDYEGHWYGSWIFFRFLSEHVGGRDVVRKIWEYSVRYNSREGDFSFLAIEDALQDFGRTFYNVFADFHVANLIKTIPPYHYEEGSNYPDIFRLRVSDYLYRKDTFLRRYAANYYEIQLPYRRNPGDAVEFRLTPVDSVANFLLQIVTVQGNRIGVEQLDPRRRPVYRLESLQEVERLYAIVSNMDSGGLNGRYRLDIKRDVQLSRLVHGFIFSRNPYGLVTSVQDTLRIVDDVVSLSLTGVKDFVQSPTEDVVALVGDSIYVYYKKKRAPFTVPDSLNLFGFPEQVKLFDIDGSTVWLAGRAVYRAVRRTDLIGNPFVVEKISEDGLGEVSELEAPERLIADRARAVWYNLYLAGDYLYGADFWVHSREGVEKLLSWQNRSPEIVSTWDWRDGVLTWVRLATRPNQSDTVAYYDLGSGERGAMEVPVTVEHLKTAAGRIAWSAGPDVFLRDGRRIRRLGGPAPSGRPVDPVSWLDMDSSGVAWATLEASSDALIPSFYYYSFADDKTYFARLADMDLVEDPRRHDGRTIQLLQGAIYFAAIEPGSGIDWPFVFILRMREPLPTGIPGHRPGAPPVSFILKPNAPNPFTRQTTIRFLLSRPAPVNVRVYDVLGREVYSRVYRNLPPGEHRVALNTNTWHSGLYLYTVSVGSEQKSGKMLLVR